MNSIFLSTILLALVPTLYSTCYDTNSDCQSLTSYCSNSTILNGVPIYQLCAKTCRQCVDLNPTTCQDTQIFCPSLSEYCGSGTIINGSPVEQLCPATCHSCPLIPCNSTDSSEQTLATSTSNTPFTTNSTDSTTVSTTPVTLTSTSQCIDVASQLVCQAYAMACESTIILDNQMTVMESCPRTCGVCH